MSRVRTEYLLLAIALVLAAIYLFPLFWMYVTSIKGQSEIYAVPPTFWPAEPNLGIYAEVWTRRNMSTFLWNSLVIAAGVTTVTVLLGVGIAYVLARYRNIWIDVTLFTILMLQVLPALQEVVRRRPDMDFELVIAGDGPLREELQQQAQELGWGRRVQFLGMVSPEQVPSVIASCHFLIFPSSRRGESLGLAVLEAMACGRPVVAADSGAMRELVIAGKSGAKFAPDDVMAMSHAVQSMLECNAADFAVLCQGARNVAEQYAAERVSKALHDRLARVFGAA